MLIEAELFTPPCPLNTAVLFLVFNRLDTTRDVFQAIRKAKPPRLYIAADGARSGRIGEADKVNAVRGYILDNIDWECQVITLFRDDNLGCKYAVSSAISWFFENEEQGIILEDDCLPSQSFFWFCEELLNIYKNDLRVWHISGDNFQKGVLRGESSYYFSKFNHIWGWATWATRWQAYDVEISSFQYFEHDNKFRNIVNDKKEKRYWMKIFQDVMKGKIDTWDYQWTYTMWCNQGLSVLPNVNLISNIGFGSAATHTMDLESQHSKIPRLDLNFPLIHPTFVVREVEADEFTAEKIFSGASIFMKVLNKIFNKLKL